MRNSILAFLSFILAFYMAFLRFKENFHHHGCALDELLGMRGPDEPRQISWQGGWRSLAFHWWIMVIRVITMACNDGSNVG